MYAECGLNGFERFWAHFGSIPVGLVQILVCAECGLNGFEWFWRSFGVDSGRLGGDLRVRRVRSKRF